MDFDTPLPFAFPPGSETKITPLPLSDETIRLESMKIASSQGRSNLIAIAGQIEAYIRYGRLSDGEGFRTIGPECFVSDDGLVISFMGENFYQACGNIVRRDEELITHTCVKRKHHPGTICEDYSGETRDTAQTT
jgi:hypothetical protein